MNKTIPLANAMACGQCHDHRQLDFDFTMAFQPIVDVRRRCIFAYEALVRGCDGESAADVIARVNQDNRYAFDQQCRVKATALAAAGGDRTDAGLLVCPTGTGGITAGKGVCRAAITRPGVRQNQRATDCWWLALKYCSS